MVDPGAFYKISYGLYIVSSGDRDKGNGFISNTVFQVTSEPAKFAACCNKENYTSEFIIRTAAFSVSVLDRDASSDLISRFGYRSGKEINKMDGLDLSYGVTGVPIVLNDSIAWLELSVEDIIDAGTHNIFIGRLVSSSVIDGEKEPLTYSYYRQVKKGIAPKNAPTYIDPGKYIKSSGEGLYKQYRCPICGYIYDERTEGKRFSDLPSDWICPVCGCEKSEFVETNQ
ncbi:MAG TPA: flavin reductase [Bacteroidales bacterium]|nr:flavin reductase [Bacteroidales bacterium]